MDAFLMKSESCKKRYGVTSRRRDVLQNFVLDVYDTDEKRHDHKAITEDFQFILTYFRTLFFCSVFKGIKCFLLNVVSNF